MNYREIWNEIVGEYNKNRNAKEEIIQNSWELLLKFLFGYSKDAMKYRKLIITVFIALFALLPMAAEEPPMESSGWHNDDYMFSKFYSTAYQYREQDGYALVQGRKLHYWFYDTITYKEYHGGNTSIIYDRVIPYWVEQMGYVIDYDNIHVSNPNPALATSVRTLMKLRGADISVALVTDSKPHYVVINEYFPSKDSYKCTIYYLYK